MVVTLTSEGKSDYITVLLRHILSEPGEATPMQSASGEATFIGTSKTDIPENTAARVITLGGGKELRIPDHKILELQTALFRLSLDPTQRFYTELKVKNPCLAPFIFWELAEK